MDDLKDGWIVVREGEDYFWTVWDNGKFLFACSQEFKDALLAVEEG
jgi:hypothetical protein